MSYKKENNTSFALGAYAVCEALRAMPNLVRRIYTSRELVVTDEISAILATARKSNIVVEDGTKLLKRVGGKDNIYLMAEFDKFSDTFDHSDQIVLHNPSDMGNVGTILRTALGFGVKNVAFIKPCVDVFNPRVVRASQGAIFSLNIRVFDSWEDYLAENAQIPKYLFMLDRNAQILQKTPCPSTPKALVFGNEATGLPASLKSCGIPTIIQHSTEIDSLNLGVAVSIALYHFSKI